MAEFVLFYIFVGIIMSAGANGLVKLFDKLDERKES